MTRFTHTPRRRIAVLAAFTAVIIVVTAFVVRQWRINASALKPVWFAQAQGGVGIVQFSRDGRLLLTTGAGDGAVTLRDAFTGHVLRQWQSDSRENNSTGRAWLSTDQTRVLTTAPSLDGPTRCALRDAATGRTLREWTGRILDALPDLSLMVAADDYHGDAGPQTILNATREGRVVDVATGRVLGRFPFTTDWQLRLSRDGHFLCLLNYNRPTRLLRVPEMTDVFPLPPLNGLRISRDGTRALGVSDDGALHLWSLASGHHTTVSTGMYQALWVSDLPDGALAVYGLLKSGQNSQSVIQVRSANGSHLLRSLPGEPQGYSPDGRLFAMSPESGDRHLVNVVDPGTGKRIAQLHTPLDPLGNSLSRQNLWTGHVALSPDGRRLAYATREGLLAVYALTGPTAPNLPVSTDSGQALLSFPAYGGWRGIFDAVTLPGGGVAASGGSDNPRDERQVQVWRPDRATLSVPAVVGNGDVSRLGVSPDGRLLAGSSQWGVWILDMTSGGSQKTPITVATDGTQFFDSQQVGRPVWLNGPSEPFTVVSTGMFGEGPIRLTRWDGAGRKIDDRTVVPAEQTLDGHLFKLAEVEVSPNGGMLAALWNGVVHRTEDGKPVDEITRDGMLELRETRTGRLLRTLLTTQREPRRDGVARAPGLEAPLGALGRPVFSPDARLVALADDDGRIFVWETATGRKRGEMSEARADDTSHTLTFVDVMSGNTAVLAFTPDDRCLAAARDDGSLYLYSLRTFLPAAQVGQVSSGKATGWGIHKSLTWMAFDSRGKTLYGIPVNSANVLAWDVPNVEP